MATKLQKHQAALKEKLANITFTGNDANKQMEQITAAVVTLGLEVHVGRIAFASVSSDGTLQVQFDEPGHGYSSRWPEWAFIPARDSLLHGKQVFLISAGTPFGSNLLQVAIMSKNV